MTVIGAWQGLPASVKEPIRSYLVSSFLAIQGALPVIIGVGYGLGQCGTPLATLHFLGANWWTAFLGLAFGVGPYYRARQGFIAAANTVQLAGGASAVITPSKGA